LLLFEAIQHQERGIPPFFLSLFVLCSLFNKREKKKNKAKNVKGKKNMAKPNPFFSISDNFPILASKHPKEKNPSRC